MICCFHALAILNSGTINIGVCECQATSVVSGALQPYGLQPARLLCPWDSLGNNTGMGCHALLQGIFLTQGLNPHLYIFTRLYLAENLIPDYI